MAVIIKACSTSSDFKVFVKFPFSLYKGNKFWVPPIINDEIKTLQSETNPAYSFCDAQFWLAYKNGKVVGRIGAIINKSYNKKTGEPMGRFTRLEMIDDAEVAKQLFTTAEKWMKEKGMKGVHGPLGFTNLDGQGMLVEGFDQLPSIASVYHMSYYGKLVEQNGYVKENDWVEFRLTIDAIPEKALKLNELIKTRSKLKVITFKKSAELMPYAKQVFAVLNQAFDELPYVNLFTDELIDFYAKKYFKFLNPKFVKIIQSEDGQLVAFIVGVPSLSNAMQKANGRLFPFGFWHILQAFKKPEVVDLFLTGIDPKHQGQGVPAVLITELQKTMIENGVKYAETTGIFESNHKAITTWKNYTHIQHKRKRAYRKMF